MSVLVALILHCLIGWREIGFDGTQTRSVDGVDLFVEAHVLWHNRDSLGVDRVQVVLLELLDNVVLRTLHQCGNRVTTKTHVLLETLCNLADEAIERGFAHKQLGAPLILANLVQGASLVLGLPGLDSWLGSNLFHRNSLASLLSDGSLLGDSTSLVSDSASLLRDVGDVVVSRGFDFDHVCVCALHLFCVLNVKSRSGSHSCRQKC